VKLKTAAFGEQEYDEESVVHLPEGMLGFSRLNRYVLVEDEEIQPFRWLQCVDDAGLAFPVVDPHVLVGDYVGEIPAEELRRLEIQSPSDMLTLVVVILKDKTERPSVNLKAPVLINHRKMIGRQIILTGSAYEVQTQLQVPRDAVHNA
jgi:flagellar assembly factor FliW